MDLTLYEVACVFIQFQGHFIVHVSVYLFFYYTFDFPPNWLATHVMSCPGCLVFVLLVLGALLKLVAERVSKFGNDG